MRFKPPFPRVAAATTVPGSRSTSTSPGVKRDIVYVADELDDMEVTDDVHDDVLPAGRQGLGLGSLKLEPYHAAPVREEDTDAPQLAIEIMRSSIFMPGASASASVPRGSSSRKGTWPSMRSRTSLLLQKAARSMIVR